jgi:hypothetical protein
MGSLLGKSEKALFDQINSEVYVLAGTDQVHLWKWYSFIGNLASVSGGIDLMYGEPVYGSKHYEPYKVIAFFERPSFSADSTSEGLQNIKEGRVQISRKICENRKVPKDKNGYHIQIGDIFEFFRHGRTFFFEVKNMELDGWINDQDTWTQYLLDVVYNETFTPQRKLVGSTNGRV